MVIVTRLSLFTYVIKTKPHMLAMLDICQQNKNIGQITELFMSHFIAF
jgi:hypothetical protein